MEDEDKKKIRIVKDGPYLVSGGVRLYEKIITPKGNQYELLDGRELTQNDSYALCRCGKSETAPHYAVAENQETSRSVMAHIFL